jgi:hypothetical protein
MASSPKNLRERREDSEPRTVSIDDQPQPSRGKWLRTLNSPLFLWLMSAIFISFAGLMVTKRSACISEADQLSDRFTKLDNEIFFRQTYIANVLKQAKSLNDLRSKLKAVPSQRQDLAAQNLDDLIDEREKMRTRIDFSGDNDPMFDQIEHDSAILAQQHVPLGILSELFRGRVISDVELSDIKFYAALEEPRILSHDDYAKSQKFEPNCSAFNIFLSAILGQRRPIVKVETTDSNTVPKW